MTNTEIIGITNKKPTETTAINKKASSKQVCSDIHSDDKIIYQSKNLAARTNSNNNIGDLHESLERLNVSHELPTTNKELEIPTKMKFLN